MCLTLRCGLTQPPQSFPKFCSRLRSYKHSPHGIGAVPLHKDCPALLLSYLHQLLSLFFLLQGEGEGRHWDGVHGGCVRTCVWLPAPHGERRAPERCQCYTVTALKFVGCSRDVLSYIADICVTTAPELRWKTCSCHYKPLFANDPHGTWSAPCSLTPYNPPPSHCTQPPCS